MRECYMRPASVLDGVMAISMYDGRMFLIGKAKLKPGLLRTRQVTVTDNAKNTAAQPAADLHVGGGDAGYGVITVAAPSSAKPTTGAPAAAGAVAAAFVVVALWLLLR